MKTHGMRNTRIYHTWCKMRERCSNRNLQNYERYGGKGITVCNEWHNFINFKNDMYASYLEHVEKHGEKQTTLDRIDSKGNYNSLNCRWATYKVQNENRSMCKKRVVNRNKDKNKFIAISPNGVIHEHYHQKQFANEHGLSPSGVSNCLNKRLEMHKGWKFYFVRRLTE